MDKNDYIKAMDEIKADDILKQKTIQKITSKKKQPYVIARRVLSAAAVFVLIFSFAYVNRNIPKQEEKNLASAKLETVGSYDNMKKIYENNNQYEVDYRRNVYYGIVEDSVNVAETVKEDSLEYSTTNVQVEGVDEADIVKNNDKYIFYYRKNEKDIKIIDAKNNMLIDTLNFDNNIRPSDMYLNGERLVVVTIMRTGKEQNYKSMVKVFNYDISNINNVKVVKEVEIDGNLLDSRMAGDYIYIVSNQRIYSNMIEDENLLKPAYRDSCIGEETQYVEYDEIQCFPNSTENIYMIVSSFNVKEDEKVNIQTYLGSGNEVYASTSNLYVTGRKYVKTETSIDEGYSSYVNNTAIYKLGFNKGKIEYVAETTIPGNINDQFSMDEHNGNLRIATTYNAKETSYKNVNNLYVLDEKLNLIGQIENIAPNENIHSVRFMGNKAYMVTFKQVDPLFVIDLSNPRAPKILGELKIPGYSEYLHPYDETHIIGFGKDTKSTLFNVKETGFKMALFDVSDLSNPKEMYSVKIGDAGTYSELLSNHKALLFSKDKNIIAFPITVREKQNNSEYYSKTTFSGAVIYGLSLEDGFEERAKIESNSVKSTIDRIIYIGNNIYTLDNNGVKIIDMNTMKEIGKIEF